MVVRPYGLVPCIDMSDVSFSVVTSIFTVGGLLGSAVANLFMDGSGRKGTLRICAALTAVGAAVMGLSNSVPLLAIGRFLIGIGSGIALCAVPIFFSEISPSRISGSVGVLTQLGTVFGIMTTQGVGLGFASRSDWRWVLFISSGLALGQFLTSAMMPESPAWLQSKGLAEERRKVASKIWGSVGYEPILEEGSPAEEERPQAGPGETVKVPQLFTSREFRRPLLVVCFAMLAQQVSGINAVLYYSNAILSKSLPSLGPYVSLGITVVNVLMTFPPIILIEKMGRRQLLTLSISGALASVLLVGFGLDSGTVQLSSVSIVLFVMSFAIGLGPVPFVMIPEVSPPRAVSALSSVALSLNWIANFLVGLLFLPVRNLLSGGDPNREGRVFYLFAALLFSSSFVLSRVYRR